MLRQHMACLAVLFTACAVSTAAGDWLSGRFVDYAPMKDEKVTPLAAAFHFAHVPVGGRTRAWVRVCLEKPTVLDAVLLDARAKEVRKMSLQPAKGRAQAWLDFDARGLHPGEYRLRWRARNGTEQPPEAIATLWVVV